VAPIDALKTLTRATLTACCLAIGLFALAPDGVGAAGQDEAPAQSQAPAPDETPAPQGYVGSDTCLTCHESQSLHGTAHGNEKLPGSPAATQGCESCHGPGAQHVEDDDKGHMRKFGQMAPREVSETCVTCHNRSEHAMWEGSAHSARNLGCATCHSVHSFKSDRGQLVKANPLEVCATCHKSQVQKQLRSAHMPVREGKMTCSTCHNPHGSTNVKQLRVGNYVNESCVSCHAEKRGPFLWEHAAGREACSTCHDPHGSNNDRMLVARQPSLCQRCHIGTRHPSTIYDGTALANRSNRLVLRGCTNCHQQIHGSNHPSGFSFAR
jgi:DmsE family decaheme c-type cytochrome